MILASECMVCAQRITLEAAQHVTRDESDLKTITYKMMDVIKDAFRDGLDSFLVGLRMMEIIEEVTGHGDPYKDFKRRCTSIAQQLAPTVREMVEKSPQALREACRTAVMGNLLDVIAGNSPELVDTGSFFGTPLAIDSFDQFQTALQSAEKIIYMADNAGEVFFDRILIDRIRKERDEIPIDYFIKGYPFLSDAQYEDVAPTLMHQVASIKVVPLIKPVVMNQSYILSMYEEFLSAVGSPNLVVVKGQANYELFVPLHIEAFYLFVHKCPVIAQAEGADIGQAVFLKK
jgi:damage-control phosphatase, subfamily I